MSHKTITDKMNQEMKISILEIKDDVVWMVFIDHNKKPIFKQPLARSIRDYLAPEYKLDKVRGDGYNTEQAFKKLEISTALDSELKRA